LRPSLMLAIDVLASLHLFFVRSVALLASKQTKPILVQRCHFVDLRLRILFKVEQQNAQVSLIKSYHRREPPWSSRLSACPCPYTPLACRGVSLFYLVSHGATHECAAFPAGPTRPQKRWWFIPRILDVHPIYIHTNPSTLSAFLSSSFQMRGQCTY
jgi:hypothetical protein